jgi:hypothetical protein
LKSARTETEIADALEDVQATLGVIVAHLGLEKQVKHAVAAKRAKVELSRQEIERSLGHRVDAEGDSRR